MSPSPLFFKFEDSQLDLISLAENGSIPTILGPSLRFEVILNGVIDFLILLKNQFKDENVKSERTNTEIRFDENRTDPLGNVLCIRTRGRQKNLFNLPWSQYCEKLLNEFAALYQCILRQSSSLPPVNFECPVLAKVKLILLQDQLCSFKEQKKQLERKICNMRKEILSQVTHLERVNRELSHQNSCLVKKSRFTSSMKDEHVLISRISLLEKELRSLKENFRR